MLLLKPSTIETIAITVATPITMPRTVREARSLCARTARSANRTFSPKPRRQCEKKDDMLYFLVRASKADVLSLDGFNLEPRTSHFALGSLIPQRFHRRQPPRFRGRDQARGQTRYGRDSDAEEDEGEPHLRRKDLVDEKRDPGSENDAEEA